MAVREFKLINENEEEYSLMDIENYCLLTDPTGLGVTYENEYVQLENTFIQNSKKISQVPITGTLNFSSYDNYKDFADFVQTAENLKLEYIVPFSSETKKYYRDISLQSLNKTQKQTNGIISEEVSFDCFTLWYEESSKSYTLDAEDDEIRWDFVWDSSRFIDYSSREIKFKNSGHAEAPIEVEIYGEVVNPAISLYIDDVLEQYIGFNVTVEEGETLYYSSKENDFYMYILKENGSTESLFSLDYIDFENDIAIRVPKGKSCTILLTSDNSIENAKISIFSQYTTV